MAVSRKPVPGHRLAAHRGIGRGAARPAFAGKVGESQGKARESGYLPPDLGFTPGPNWQAGGNADTGNADRL